MQKSETAKVLKLLKTAYPANFKGQTAEEYDMLTDLWTYQFQQYTLVQVFQALNAAISSKTDGFPPSIGEIKMRLMDITDPDVIDFETVWKKIRSAYGRGSVHAQEDWEQMPEQIREIITPQEIKETAQSESYNEEVNRSLIYRRWLAKKERRRIDKSVPAPVRDAMAAAKVKALETLSKGPVQIEDRKTSEDKSTRTDPLRNSSHGVTMAELLEKKKAEMEAKKINAN